MRTDPKEPFNFSKKNRNAAFVLFALIVIITAANFFYNPYSNQPEISITTLEQELAKQGIDTASNADEQIAYVPLEESEITNNSTSELFPFDPNTLDASGFKRLGLQDKIINTIIKYRSKGGQFRKPDDLRKIYTLSKEDADRLVPYVQIAGQQPNFTGSDKIATDFTKPKPAVIDINTATAEQWKALPMVGDVLASRIVKFRDKIGGFTSVAQVKQTYGLSDSAFKAIEPYLKLSSIPPKAAIAEKTNADSKKININTASLNQLKSNPHIPEEIAQAIIIYRTQHGNYNTVEDVKKIVFITDETYRQIAPYIVVE
jgi:competence ComEA-like helix-hairpin-helix protein